MISARRSLARSNCRVGIIEASPCLGVILTPPAIPDSSTGKNAAAIARLSGIDRIITLPQTADQQAAAHTLQPVLSWVGRIAAPA